MISRIWCLFPAVYFHLEMVFILPVTAPDELDVLLGIAILRGNTGTARFLSGRFC